MQNLLKINNLNKGTPSRAQEIDGIEIQNSQVDGTPQVEISESFADPPKAFDAHLQTITKESIMSNRDSLLKSMTREEKLAKFETMGRQTEKDDGRIIKDENEEIINVDMGTYKNLMKRAGGWCLFFTLNIIMLFFTVSSILQIWIVTKWSDDIENQQSEYL